MTIDVRTAESLGKNIIEQVVVRGDTANLSPEEKAKYYISLCASLGLNPATQPIEFIRFQGREIAYVKRGGADQMAALHRLNREVVEGPEIRKVGNQDVAYCKVVVTHPNGRREMEVATLPLKDPTMDMMKVLTKAKRRGTISILGLGMLDESEVDDMVGAEPVGTISTQKSPPRLATACDEPSKTPALDALNADLDALDERGVSLLDACRVWLKHKDAIGAECRGDSEYMFTAQQAVLGALKVGATANQLNEHVQILEMRAKTPDGGTYPTVLDLLALADIGSDVVQIWKDNSTAISERSAEIQLLLKKAATRRVQEIEPGLEDVRKAGQWLKSQLSPKDKPPAPPNGGGKPEAPANEVDEERASIQQADSVAPAASVDMNTEDARLRAALAEIDNKEHLASHVAAHEHEYGLPTDAISSIALTRFEQLGLSRQQGMNMLRVSRNKRSTGSRSAA